MYIFKETLIKRFPGGPGLSFGSFFVRDAYKGQGHDALCRFGIFRELYCLSYRTYEKTSLRNAIANTPGYQNAQKTDMRAKDTHTVISGEEETNGLETKGQ